MLNNSLIEEYQKIIKDKIAKKEYLSASVNAEKFIQNFPDCELAYYFLGVVQFWLREYDKSIENSLKAIEIKPDFAKAFYNLGISQYFKGDSDNGIVNITKAMLLFNRAGDEEAKFKCFDSLKFIKHDLR